MFKEFIENAKFLLNNKDNNQVENPENIDEDEFDVNYELLAGYYHGGYLYGGTEYSK